MAVAVLKTETVQPEQTRRRRPSAEKAGGAETKLWPPVIMAAAAWGSRVLGLGVENEKVALAGRRVLGFARRFERVGGSTAT